jgi:hypothetical protein
MRLAVAAIAGFAALALAVPTGYGERARLPPRSAPLFGPFPDPGDGLTDTGEPVDPPPPAGGIGALGPGSPDSGADLPHPHPGGDCIIQPHENEKQCFKLDGATRFIVENRSGGWSFDIVEKLASDSTPLRTRPLGSTGARVMSFMPNTTITVVSRSPWPREFPRLIRFADGQRSGDFLCEVPIHNPYFPDDWGNHAKCTWTGGNSWLALFTNYGDRPVDVNEWNGGRHGRTEVRPREPTVLALPNNREFWVGVGGEPGPPIRLTVTDYIIANGLREMWVRDEATIDDVPNHLAVNLSPYAITLFWNTPEGPQSLPLPGNQRRQLPPSIRRGTLTGRKARGNGEIARVLFVPPGGGGIDDIYPVITPRPQSFPYPFGVATLLSAGYRSVQATNKGPRPVGLLPWSIPFFVPLEGIQLNPGETRILPLFDATLGPATIVTGLVEPPAPGANTNVELTQWVPCRNPVHCDTRHTPTLNSLTGSATGLDAGQVQLTLRGRLTLPRSGSDLALTRAGIDLISVLDEAGGAGELVDATGSRSVHLVAHASRGGTTVFFEARPPETRPFFQMQVTRRSGLVLDFTLKVATSALSKGPELCSTAQPPVTDLATRFIISDGLHPPIDFATVKSWECIGDEPQEPSALRLQ